MWSRRFYSAGTPPTTVLLERNSDHTPKGREGFKFQFHCSRVLPLVLKCTIKLNRFYYFVMINLLHFFFYCVLNINVECILCECTFNDSIKYPYLACHAYLNNLGTESFLFSCYFTGFSYLSSFMLPQIYNFTTGKNTVNIKLIMQYF